MGRERSHKGGGETTREQKERKSQGVRIGSKKNKARNRKQPKYRAAMIAQREEATHGLRETAKQHVAAGREK